MRRPARMWTAAALVTGGALLAAVSCAKMERSAPASAPVPASTGQPGHAVFQGGKKVDVPEEKPAVTATEVEEKEAEKSEKKLAREEDLKRKDQVRGMLGDSRADEDAPEAPPPSHRGGSARRPATHGGLSADEGAFQRQDEGRTGERRKSGLSLSAENDKTGNVAAGPRGEPTAIEPVGRHAGGAPIDNLKPRDNFKHLDAEGGSGFAFAAPSAPASPPAGPGKDGLKRREADRRPTGDDDVDDLISGLDSKPKAPRPPAYKPAPDSTVEPAAQAQGATTPTSGLTKALESNQMGKGPLQGVFSDKTAFASKLNAAMSGEGSEFVMGHGDGGMGKRGLAKTPEPTDGRFRDRTRATRDGEGWADNGVVSDALRWEEGDALNELGQAGGVPTAEPRPDTFLPRMFYFENTYLGGNAAFTRRLLALDAAWTADERPYASAAGPRQPFDAPDGSGLGLTVQLDRSHLERPGRVYLQIGLQGSPRYGWRRPPLDLTLVVDAPVLAEAREAVDALARAALRRLEPADRLSVVLSGPTPRVLVDLMGPRDLRVRLAPVLDKLPTEAEAGTPGALGTAVRLAGERLREAAGNEARIPGAQEVLVLARGADADRVDAAAAAAHEIGVTGVITSVVRLDSGPDVAAPGSALAFWDIAQAGQGNLRSLRPGDDPARVLSDELADLSRVVARLIRVNVRLGPKTEAIRVLGSRMLEREEVAQVKAREEAVDRNLSKTLGVKADRGLDDDGIQTVIPYFYGGDAHVMAVELWVDGPGPVADVSLKYKDMVNLSNATARAGASLAATPRARTGAELFVRRNVQAFLAAEALAKAAGRLEAGDPGAAATFLDEADRRAVSTADREVLAAFRRVIARGDTAAASEALRVAAARKVGVFAR